MVIEWLFEVRFFALEIFLETKHMGTQSCPTLCHDMNCSPPGFFIHGIGFSKERILDFAPQDLPNPGIKPVSPVSPALARSIYH